MRLAGSLRPWYQYRMKATPPTPSRLAHFIVDRVDERAVEITAEDPA